VGKATISGYNKTKDIFDLDADLYTSSIVLSSMFIIFFLFFVQRRPAILGGEFNNVASPKFFCSFGGCAMSTNIGGLHIDPVNIVYCWLYAHNVNN